MDIDINLCLLVEGGPRGVVATGGGVEDLQVTEGIHLR